MKKAQIAQPDLDYMAPEVQLESSSYAATACDVFALGSLICAVYNAGCTPIRASCNVATYASHVKQVPCIALRNCIIIIIGCDYYFGILKYNVFYDKVIFRMAFQFGAHRLLLL